MPNSINTLSPSFRDYLLLKNLVTDTVIDNSLQSLLGGIGFPAQTETLPNAVQPSNSINDTYQIYQESNTILNQYQGGIDDYSQINIIYNPIINSSVGLYNNNNDLLNESFYSNGVLTNSETIRKELTLKNIYVDVPKQSIIDLNTQPVPVYQNLSSYLDENNNLNVGGPSTQAADLLGGLINGQGVGLNFTNGGGLLANESIRSTLLGRVLGATGVINDTPLGNIGGQQLLAHVGYNASFGLQQETLGKLNLNPLNLIQGSSPINLNYSITVPKNTVGKVLNFAANILGVQSPISLLQSSIFSFDDKGIFIGVENIKMGNDMIKNSGKGQVNSLFNNLRANTRIDNPNGTNLRQGYAPGYTDDRKVDGQNVGDGLNPNLYSRDDGNGELINFINGEANSPISSTNYELSKQISNDGWDKEYFRKINYNAQKNNGALLYKDAWGWGDARFNYDFNVGRNEDSRTAEELNLFGSTEKNKKTLLYKTQQLFNSDNMRTLVTGHGIKEDGPTQINSAVSSVGKYTSKGSGVLSNSAILTGVDNGAENVFCRTWTTYDRYAQVGDLQKSRGLDGAYLGKDNKAVYRGNIGASVLQDNGFVKIAPIKNLEDNTKFMFSIENLAWAGEDFNLLPCERGPGDGNLKGRIMWFPPYDITFSETTTASWDKHNFIGRGEPMYTYNNTERSGSLNWKIIIDHPNYMNFISSKTKQQGGNFDDLLASYFAGCVDYRDLDDLITTDEKDKTEVVNTQKKPEVTITKETPPPSFDVYFPNDVYDVDKYPNYEDGRCDNDNKSPNLLFTLTGHVDLVEYSEFNSDGSKVVTASFDDTAKIWDVSNGNILFNLSGHTDVLVTAKFNTDSSKIITASMDNTAKIWDVSSGNELITLSGHTDGVTSANFNSDGSKVVTSSYDNTAKIWDSSNGNILFDLVGHTDWVNIAEFNSDGTKVITGSNDNTAKIWDSSNGNILFSLSGHTDLILSVEFNSDSTKVLSASVDNTVKVWDTSNGNLLNTLSDAGSLAKFNSDGTKVVVTAINDTAKIWDISTNNIIILEGHTNIVRSAEFNSGDTKVITASNDNTAKIWDANTGKLLSTLEGHTDEVNIAKFSLDGNKVVTSSNDNTAKIWEVDVPECLINYKVNENGDGFGIGDYYESCYEYPKNGVNTWSSTKCSETKGPEGANGRVEPDRTDFGLNASGGSKNTSFFTPVTLDGKTYKSWRDPEYHKDLQKYLLSKCKSCKVQVTGYASSVGTNPKDRNAKLSTLRADNVKDWLKKNVLTDPPFSERVGIASSGEGISTARGECPVSPESRIKNYKDSLNDVIGCKANRYVTVKFVIDENLIPKNEAGIEQESKNNESKKTPAISTSRFYTECDYFEKLQESSPVAYNSIKEQIKYFQPAFHSTTPEGFNARLTFLQQCMRQGPTNGAGSNNNPNNLAFGRPPVCILRIGDFYHTKIVIENLSFSFEPLVWDLNPEGIGVQPMICNVDMSFAFIGGSSLNGPINRLQNAVSFNYYANNEIYDNRPDTIKINGNVTEIVDGEKDITGEKNKAPLAQDTSGLTNKVEPVKDQVKEEVVANSGTENSQPLTSGTTNNENSEPVETPVEKVKKYPGFDENSGIYTTENAHKIKDILTLVIPKGTKIYTSDKQITSNFSLFDNYETYDNKRYITVSQVMNPNDKKTPNNIYYNKIEFNCKFKQFLVYETPLNIDYPAGVPTKNARIYSENNNSLSNVLSDIFCKTDKTKTFNEIKKFDNTK